MPTAVVSLTRGPGDRNLKVRQCSCSLLPWRWKVDVWRVGGCGDTVTAQCSLLTLTASILYCANRWSRTAIASRPCARLGCCRQNPPFAQWHYICIIAPHPSLKSTTHRHKGYSYRLFTYCGKAKYMSRNVYTCLGSATGGQWASNSPFMPQRQCCPQSVWESTGTAALTVGLSTRLFCADKNLGYWNRSNRNQDPI